MNNYERIRIDTRSINGMAKTLTEDEWSCNVCSEHIRLSDNPLLKNDSCDSNCLEHCKEWLSLECDRANNDKDEISYERLLYIANKLRSWIFLHVADEISVYSELGITDNEIILLRKCNNGR